MFGSFLYTDPWDTSQHTFDLAGVTVTVTVTEDPYMLDGSGRRVRGPSTVSPFVTPEPCYPIDGRVSPIMPENRDPNWPTFALSYTAAPDDRRRRDRRGDHTDRIHAWGPQCKFRGDGRPPSL